MAKIFLTGGTGFIGSHTAFLLLDKGFEVIVIDSLINSSQSVVSNLKRLVGVKDEKLKKNLKFYKADIRDKSFLKEIFHREYNKKCFSAVIHFAGLKSVGESNTYPLKYWDNNVKGTVNLLEVMEEMGCKNIIFSSSATIYGDSNGKPINESFQINPTNPYGNTKAAIEYMLNDIFKSNQTSWKIANLRYFNPVGGHDSGLIGENPKGDPNNIFPIIARVANKEISKLKIFGKDWETCDGTGVRDYIHVMDVANGHVRVLDYLKNEEPQILNLNLGTGNGTSVLELLKTYEKVNEVKIPFEFVARRKGDVAIVVADNKKAKSLLNWEPEKNLIAMCKDSWNWKIKNSK